MRNLRHARFEVQQLVRHQINRRSGQFGALMIETGEAGWSFAGVIVNDKCDIVRNAQAHPAFQPVGHVPVEGYDQIGLVGFEPRQPF